MRIKKKKKKSFASYHKMQRIFHDITRLINTTTLHPI